MRRSWVGGGHTDRLKVKGRWSVLESQQHINLLELWAVSRSLEALGPMIFEKNILIRSDNATVVSYINKEGGTKSPTLCLHTRHLILWTKGHGIRLSAVHIPGVQNMLADNLSRGVSLSPTEWTLSSQIFQELIQLRHFPTVDLFASSLNHRLPVYCSRSRDDRALACDALAMSWEGLAGYAFPPISLIPRVLQKINRETCLILLIAPWWPRQTWFQTLLDLQVDHPIQLPQTSDLLRMPRSKVRFHDVPSLHLTAWTLSNSISRRRVFLKKLPLWLPGEDVSPPLE